MKVNNKVLRSGGIIAIVENSHGLIIGEHLYSFNDHIVKQLYNVDASKSIIEVNPFYIEPRASDLISLVNSLLSLGEVHVKTYYEDPVANKMPLTWRTGALTMEYEK